jgi:hypothetical protein
MDFLPTLLQAIAFVPTLVSGIEGLFSHRTGVEKREAALSFLQAALSTSSAIATRQIVDQEKFKDGLGKLIDGSVECLNASAWAKNKVAAESNDLPASSVTIKPDEGAYPTSSLQFSSVFFTKAMN